MTNPKLDHLLQQLQAGIEISKLTNRFFDLEELLSTAAPVIQRQFGFSQVAVFLLEGKNRLPILKAFSGQSEGQEAADLVAKQKRDEMVAQVLERRKPYILRGATDKSAPAGQPAPHGIASEAALPLLVGEQLLGVLHLACDEPDTLKDDMLTTLQLIASQLGLAIHHARHIQEKQALLESGPLFHRCCRQINRSSNRHQLTEALLRYLASAPITVGQLIFAEPDPDGQTLLMVAKNWSGNDRPGVLPVPISNGAQHPLQELIFSKSTTLVKDVKADPRLQPDVGPTLAQAEIASLMVIPLIAGQEQVGAIIIGKNTPGPFDQPLIEESHTLADQTAVALQRQRLLQDLRQRAILTKVEGAVADQLGTNVTTQQILDTVVQQIGQTLGASRVAIRLHK